MTAAGLTQGELTAQLAQRRAELAQVEAERRPVFAAWKRTAGIWLEGEIARLERASAQAPARKIPKPLSGLGGGRTVTLTARQFAEMVDEEIERRAALPRRV